MGPRDEGRQESLRRRQFTHEWTAAAARAYLVAMVRSTPEQPEIIRPVFTYEDLRLMPDDRNRYEVIDGELLVTPSPTIAHQTASKRIQLELMLQLERTGRALVFAAPVDVIFSQLRTVVPDLVIIDQSRRNIVSRRGIEGAPDVIIEILSPSSRRNDRELKAKLYAAEGVREYWLVDDETCTIEVWTLDAGAYRLHGRFGPGEKLRSFLYDVDLGVDAVFAP